MRHSATVRAHSVSPDGVELATLTVRMPRIVLAEFNTHRVFSRNSASSRAIPVLRRIADVESGPFIPRLTIAGKGMASNDYVDEREQEEWDHDSLVLLGHAAAFARKWAERGHKQHVNRYLEPWSYTEVVVSSTEWEGFFALRCHPNAQPEIREVAETMRAALLASIPEPVPYGGWHLPFVTKDERDRWGLDYARRVAVGRLARVSYLTHDGRRDPVADVELCDRLRTAEPAHASPFEHVATPSTGAAPCRGNFHGWRQYRHMVCREPGR